MHLHHAQKSNKAGYGGGGTHTLPVSVRGTHIYSVVKGCGEEGRGAGAGLYALISDSISGGGGWGEVCYNLGVVAGSLEMASRNVCLLLEEACRERERERETHTYTHTHTHTDIDTDRHRHRHSRVGGVMMCSKARHLKARLLSVE